MVMAPHSFFGLLILISLYRVALCNPQAALSITQPPNAAPSAAPDLSGPQLSTQGCGGCYLVADVAGLVWYSEIFLHTAATAIVSVGLSNGTSKATRTSVIQNEGEFTYNVAPTSAGGALTQVNFDSTVMIAGAILTSPTAYNIFTAYSVTSEIMSDGICSTISGSSIPLSSAYSQILSSASGKVFVDAAGEQSFIDFLSFSTCSGGGENIVNTAVIQILNTTTTSTTTFSNVPLAVMSASLTIAPQSSPSSVPASTTPMTFPSVNAPKIVIGNTTTVTPTAHPIALPVFNGTAFPITVTSAKSSPVAVMTPSSVTVLSTGFTGNASATFVPFTGGVVGRDKMWVSAWGAAMVGLGALVYCL